MSLTFFTPQDDVTAVRRHLRNFLNACFEREIEDRPSAAELLEHPFILSAPGDLMRQGSELSQASNGSADHNDPWARPNNAADAIVGALGIRHVESTYDDTDSAEEVADEAPWLGSTLEAKSTGSRGLLVREPSRQDVIMQNHLNSFIQERTEETNLMSITFRKNESFRNPPPSEAPNPFASNAPNPFASNSAMFDVTGDEIARKVAGDAGDEY